MSVRKRWFEGAVLSVLVVGVACVGVGNELGATSQSAQACRSTPCVDNDHDGLDDNDGTVCDYHGPCPDENHDGICDVEPDAGLPGDDGGAPDAGHPGVPDDGGTYDSGHPGVPDDGGTPDCTHSNNYDPRCDHGGDQGGGTLVTPMQPGKPCLGVRVGPWCLTPIPDYVPCAEPQNCNRVDLPPSHYQPRLTPPTVTAGPV